MDMNFIKNIFRSIIFSFLFLMCICFFQETKAYSVSYYSLKTSGGTWNGTYYKLNNIIRKNCFFCDGTYTYFLMANGQPMKNRLTYHPDGVHVIFFDSRGHETFDNFSHVTKSISGKTVDDYCYFDTHGYMYVNKLTYDKSGTNLYYINPYGQMQHTGLFTFPDGAKGFAQSNGVLIKDRFYTLNGNMYYFQGNGHCAQGLITDGRYYYNYDKNGRYLGRFSASAQSNTHQSSSSYGGASVDQVVALVNIERRKAGLSELATTRELTNAANVRVKEISSVFSHTRPNGSSCFSALDQANVYYMCAAENIACGQPTSVSVMDSWMNSRCHRSNILNPRFNHIGVACQLINGTYYWVQEFSN